MRGKLIEKTAVLFVIVVIIIFASSPVDGKSHGTPAKIVSNAMNTTAQSVKEGVDTTIEDFEEQTEEEQAPSRLYEPYQFCRSGVIYWGGWRWTWYSENVLPGGGLSIPGRHVDGDGYICDGDGYICLASNVLGKYTVIDTPFGKQGKIYDSGCPEDTIDVYVSW